MHKDPVQQFAADLCLNAMSLAIEEPFEFCADAFSARDERIGNAIARSAKFRRAETLKGRVSDLDLLSGFEFLAQDSPREIGVIAWSAAEDLQRFSCVAASVGSVDSVQLPLDVAVPALLERSRQGIQTRVVLAHNHPQTALREIVQTLVNVPLGPSRADRDVLYKWFSAAANDGLAVLPEGYLYEDATWRRFVLPSTTAPNSVLRSSVKM